MTDNFKRYEEYMRSFGIIPEKKDESGKYYFSVAIIRRGKDHPELPAANHTFATFYYSNFEKYIRSVEDIRKMCDVFGCRAYGTVVPKNKERLLKQIIVSSAKQMYINEFKSPWRIVEHCSDIMVLDFKRWVVDVDDVVEDSPLVNELKQIISQCDSKAKNPVDTIFPTKSGAHIITHPFNLNQFSYGLMEKGIATSEDKAKKMTNEMVKKNHLTLLYENL